MSAYVQWTVSSGSPGMRAQRQGLGEWGVGEPVLVLYALTAWICTYWMFVESQVRRKNKDAPNLGHPGIWDIIMRSAN